MSITVSLTDGVTTIPLVYSQANQFAFKALYGTSIDPGEPLPVWHTPEGYPPELIDLYDPNRTAILGFHLLSTTASNQVDDVNNALATLRRWVDGAHQQAARYWVHGDVNRIDLIIQRNNSTVATFHPVVFGTVDDGQGQYTAAAYLNNIVYDAVIRLTLAPYGEAQDDITLSNILPGAAVDFESSTSGLAAGWVSVGTTTNTLSSAIYLVNELSQKIDASASGGVRTANIAATSTSGAGYVWVYVISGSVDVILYDETAAAARDTATIDATDSGGVSDKSVQDIGGNTWYRVPVTSAGLTNTNNHSIRTLASGGAAIAHIDAAYLRFGVSTVPDAWCSCTVIDNRADRSTTNIDYFNWIDVWGIPGDVDALVRHTIDGTVTGANGEKFILSCYKDKSGRAGVDFDHWIECEDFTGSTAGNGAWADTVVAGTSGGSVARFTASATGGAGSIYANFAYLRHPLAVYLRAAASANSLVSVTLSTPASGSPSPIISAETVTLTTDYEMWYLGVVHLESPLASGVTTGDFSIGISGFTANGQTASLDCVWLVPVVDGMVLANSDLFTGTLDGGNLVFDGANEDTYISYRVPSLGIYPTASPGQKGTRFYYGRQTETPSSDHHLTDAFSITLTIVPRTKHLLGTI